MLVTGICAGCRLYLKLFKFAARSMPCQLIVYYSAMTINWLVVLPGAALLCLPLQANAGEW